jgi:hypothetical protein
VGQDARAVGVGRARAADRVMAGRLSRFLRLERKRPPRDRKPSAVLQRERFEPPPAAGVELAAPEPEGAQPFVRCAFCEHDNSRFDGACRSCGKALDGEEQRAFNERLWSERRAQRAVEEAELAKLHAPRPSAKWEPEDEEPWHVRLLEWIEDWF